MPNTRITAGSLFEFCTIVYEALGLSKTDSELLADSLVQADLWGHQSHGVMRTFWYAERIRSGAINIAAKHNLVVDGGAIAVVDGNDGIGQLIAHSAMQEAIERSKKHGVGAVAVRNSGHFGTAMYFTRIAVPEGCVGFMSTNSSPAMAPWGGCSKLIGANPWSIAAPAGKYAPMLLDIANTSVARGKLYLARQNNEMIPEGWAIDQNGNPTTDAMAGIAGNILPMAGHKGYAIATMMDVLSGILSGSQFGSSVVGPANPEGKSGAGHLAMAINIESFRSLQEFNKDMESLVDSIKKNPLAINVDEVYYPGELEARTEKRHRKRGVLIPGDTLAELDTAAMKLGTRTLSSFI